VDDRSLGNDGNDILRENWDGLDGEILEEDSEVIVPEVGMKFRDDIEIFEFYKRYAYIVGFPVRKRNSKKGNDGVVRYVTFACY